MPVSLLPPKPFLEKVGRAVAAQLFSSTGEVKLGGNSTSPFPVLREVGESGKGVWEGAAGLFQVTEKSNVQAFILTRETLTQIFQVSK